MKHKFIFWLAKILKVNIIDAIFEHTPRTIKVEQTRLDFKRVTVKHQISRRDSKNVTPMDVNKIILEELSTKLAHEGLVEVREFEDHYNNTINFEAIILASKPCD